jgi:hypothetical protein
MPRHSLRGLLTALQGCSAGSSLVPCLVERLELLSLCIAWRSKHDIFSESVEAITKPSTCRSKVVIRAIAAESVFSLTKKWRLIRAILFLIIPKSENSRRDNERTNVKVLSTQFYFSEV